MQCIDARDMGAWTVRLAEDRVAGIFTAARPWTTFGALLDETVGAVDSDAHLVPVDGDWLVEQGVDGMQLPLWTEGGVEWSLAMATARAEDGGADPPAVRGRRPRHPGLGAGPSRAGDQPAVGPGPRPGARAPRHLGRARHDPAGPSAGRDPADDLHHDVGAGRAHRCGQPRSGVPRRRRTGRRCSTPADDAMHSGANQYAPGTGVPALRQAIARHQQRHYGLELDPDTQVVVTTGCTEGIAASLLGLVDPGDEVVVLEPYYDSYVAMIQMAGGVRRPVTLRAPDFRLDVDALRAAVGPRTRFVLLNSPHNPTGTVLTREELQAVADLADRARPRRDHRRGLRAPDLRRARARAALDAARDVRAHPDPVERRARATASPAGRSGWATGPARPRVAAVLAAKQWLTFTSGAPLQPAVAHGLDDEPDWPRGAGREPRGAARPALRRPGDARSRRTTPRGHLLRAHRHLGAGVARRHGVLPRAARAGRGGRDPDAAVPRQPTRATSWCGGRSARRRA